MLLSNQVDTTCAELGSNPAITAVIAPNERPPHQCNKIEEAHHVRIHRRLHFHHIRRRLFSHCRRHHLVNRPPITLIGAVPTNHKGATFSKSTCCAFFNYPANIVNNSSACNACLAAPRTSNLIWPSWTITKRSPYARASLILWVIIMVVS